MPLKPASQEMFLRRVIDDLHKDLAYAGRLIAERDRQIRDLEAENELLRRRIAERKPPGGRKPTPAETVSRIERAIEAGDTTRHIARQLGVSAMTISRIAARMRERQAVK